MADAYLTDATGELPFLSVEHRYEAGRHELAVPATVDRVWLEGVGLGGGSVPETAGNGSTGLMTHMSHAWVTANGTTQFSRSGAASLRTLDDWAGGGSNATPTAPSDHYPVGPAHEVHDGLWHLPGRHAIGAASDPFAWLSRDGETWSVAEAGDANARDAMNRHMAHLAPYYYLTGDDGYLARSDDPWDWAGATEYPTRAGFSYDLVGVWATPSNGTLLSQSTFTGLTNAGNEALRYSTDDGETWAAPTFDFSAFPTATAVQSISGRVMQSRDKSTLVVAATLTATPSAFQVPLVSTDGGRSWTALVTGDAANDVADRVSFAVSNTYTRQPAALSDDGRAMLFRLASPTHAFLVTFDGGVTWSRWERPDGYAIALATWDDASRGFWFLAGSSTYRAGFARADRVFTTTLGAALSGDFTAAPYQGGLVVPSYHATTARAPMMVGFRLGRAADVLLDGAPLLEGGGLARGTTRGEGGGAGRVPIPAGGLRRRFAGGDGGEAPTSGRYGEGGPPGTAATTPGETTAPRRSRMPGTGAPGVFDRYGGGGGGECVYFEPLDGVAGRTLVFDIPRADHGRSQPYLVVRW